MLKRMLAVLGVIIAMVLVVMIFKAVTFESIQREVAPATLVQVDAEAAAARLAQVIRIPSVASFDAEENRRNGHFQAIHQRLSQDFPNVHATLEREVVAEHSLLYTWKGTKPELPPVLLLAHLDVVPVDEGARERWAHDPFSGDIADGYIWGRGALDDKFAALAMLEASELLIVQGFTPERTILFAFGHDEEIGGRQGAMQLAARLSERGVTQVAFILDEGLAVVEGIVPGVTAPAALIGIAEKGFVTVHLEVPGTGGHSSMPPKHTAVGVLSRAIVRLEEHQFAPHLGRPLSQMFDALGPEMSPLLRFVFANRWLFGGVLVKQLEAKHSTNATLRTTTAATMFEGSPQDNVLPQRARAAVNYRIHPEDSIEAVIAHVERHKGDARVEVRPELDGFASEPSAISSTESAGYEVLERSIRQVFPQALVAPSLMVGATDSRHYKALSPHIYRFSALHLMAEDTARIHGTDERISVANYGKVIQFYGQILRQSQELEEGETR